MVEHWKNLSLENIEGEIWKDIPEYLDIYMGSSFGRLKSLSVTRPHSRYAGFTQTSKEKILCQTPHNYLLVVLSNNGKKNLLVHRIIAKLFIPNPENKPEINHLDGNKLNNYCLNLQWSTRSENMQHALINKLAPSGENNYNSILKKEDVIFIRENHVKGNGSSKEKIGNTRELANKYGVSEKHICAVAANKSCWLYL